MAQDPIRTFTLSPEEYQRVASSVGQPTPSHDKPLSEQIASAVETSTLPMLPGVQLPDFVKRALAGIVRGAANPENRSTMGAMAGAATGAKLGAPFGPVGALTGGMGGALLGGTAGSLTEGKSLGSAMQEGAGEALVEGAIGGPMLGAARLAHGASRGLTGAALNPSADVLQQMRQPSGALFRTPKEALREFRTRATDLMDVVPGSPGGVRYAHGVQDLKRSERLAKEGVLNTANQQGVTLTEQELIPQGTFDELVNRLAREQGVSAGPSIDNAVRETLTRTQPSGARQNLPGGRPLMMPPSRSNAWSLTDVDARLQGLQKQLDDFYAKRDAANMARERVTPTADEEALAAIRKAMSEALQKAAPTAPDGRTVADLNRSISQLIPIEQAATQATQQAAGEGIPRIRVSGTPSNPNNFQFFNYFRRGMGPAAKIARTGGKVLAGPGAQLSPQLQRLMEVLMNPKEPE